MYQIVLIIHVLLAIALIGLILIQHGKGADIGASFGSGASNTLFGSHGVGGFLFKLTGGLALSFFVTSVILSSIVSMQYQQARQIIVPIEQQRHESNIPLPANDESLEQQKNIPLPAGKKE